MKLLRAFTLTLLVTLAVLLTLHPAWAGSNSVTGQTRYIATTGQDSGDCTNSGSPCRTINYARTQSNSGDVIMLEAGLYTENVNLFTDLYLIGAGVGKTIVDGGGNERVFAIFNGHPHIQDMTIQNGDATIQGYGGGIFNNSKLSLYNVAVQNNYSPGNGGGIYNSGTLTMTLTLLQGNTSLNVGAGLVNFGDALVIQSTITNNESTSLTAYGGGIYNNSGMALYNTTISGNRAASGGGLSNSGWMGLYNVTVVGNVSSNSFAGGIVNYGTADFGNTVVADNAGGNQCDGTGTFTSLGHNLESTNTCYFSQGTDFPSTNALLRPLSSFASPIPVHLPDPHSPLIDAGDNATCQSTDERGVTRPIDGNNNSTAVCDIGAVEFNPATDNYHVFLPMVVR